MHFAWDAIHGEAVGGHLQEDAVRNHKVEAIAETSLSSL